jgi:hypothetical protein
LAAGGGGAESRDERESARHSVNVKNDEIECVEFNLREQSVQWPRPPREKRQVDGSSSSPPYIVEPINRAALDRAARGHSGVRRTKPSIGFEI